MIRISNFNTLTNPNLKFSSNFKIIPFPNIHTHKFDFHEQFSLFEFLTKQKHVKHRFFIFKAVMVILLRMVVDQKCWDSIPIPRAEFLQP